MSAQLLGDQSTNLWKDGVFARFIYYWQSVGKTLKLNSSGAFLVTAHHVNSFAGAYIIYQSDSSYTKTGYHEIFHDGSTSEFHMYMNLSDNSFYFKGNGGGIMIGILPLCGMGCHLQEVSTDVSQMTIIF